MRHSISRQFLLQVIFMSILTITLLSCNSTPTGSGILDIAQATAISSMVKQTAQGYVQLTLTPAPSIAKLTSGQTPETVRLFKITILNRYARDAYLFLDAQYLMQASSMKYATYNGIQPGQHEFRFCYDDKMQDCEDIIVADVQGDISWTLGEELTDQNTEIPLTATPALSSAIPSMPVFSTPTPLLAGSVPRYMIKIHNNYSDRIIVYIDGHHLMTIPPRKYLTYDGIKAGEHTFHHCFLSRMRICVSTKTIVIDGFKEWTVGP